MLGITKLWRFSDIGVIPLSLYAQIEPFKIKNIILMEFYLFILFMLLNLKSAI
jgi:hypothetical protein